MFDETRYADPRYGIRLAMNVSPFNSPIQSYVGLPSNDTNAWYYPSHGYHSDEDDDIHSSTAVGNWGRKTMKDARWVRGGKIAAWGPDFEDWEVRL